MKRLVLLATILASTTAMADQLHTYAQIQSAVVTGQNVHIAVDFSNCTNAKTKANSSIPINTTSIGVFNPDSYQVLDHLIATSLTHFTTNNPAAPNKPVYEFVSMAVADDSSVKIGVQVLDASNYTPWGSKYSFLCTIDVGAKFYN